MGSGSEALLVRYHTGHGPISWRDQVTFEFAAAYRHYHACLMNVVTTGRVDPRHREMFRACREALTACQATLRPGRTVGDIFATIDKAKESKDAAAAKVVGYLDAGGSPDLLFAAARRMIFHKGKDSHDYKYGAAVWEECLLASDPKWHATLVASAMFNLPGAKTPDSPLMNRAREAVKKVLG